MADKTDLSDKANLLIAEVHSTCVNLCHNTMHNQYNSKREEHVNAQNRLQNYIARLEADLQVFYAQEPKQILE